MKNKLIILMLSMLLFTGCSDKEVNIKSDKENIDTNVNVNTDIQINDTGKTSYYERKDLLMEKKQNDTKLYGTSMDGNIYDQILLEMNDTKNEFMWSSVTETEYMPEIIYLDINDDNEDELLIFNTIEHKENVWIQEAHILDTKEVEEYDIEDAISYLEENVEVYDTGIIVDGVEYELPSDGEITDKITYGDSIHFEILGDEIKSYVIVNIDKEMIGNIECTYEYKEGMLKIKKLRYDGEVR